MPGEGVPGEERAGRDDGSRHPRSTPDLRPHGVAGSLQEEHPAKNEQDTTVGVGLACGGAVEEGSDREADRRAECEIPRIPVTFLCSWRDHRSRRSEIVNTHVDRGIRNISAATVRKRRRPRRNFAVPPICRPENNAGEIACDIAAREVCDISRRITSIRRGRPRCAVGASSSAGHRWP